MYVSLPEGIYRYVIYMPSGKNAYIAWGSMALWEGVTMRVSGFLRGVWEMSGHAGEGVWV